MSEINKFTNSDLLKTTSEDIFKLLNDKLNKNEHSQNDENFILEISPSLQFHKRNRKYFHNISSITSSYLAIEPKTGKQVIWNEIFCDQKNLEKENKFLKIINQLKNANHPYLLRFYEAWVSEDGTGLRKMVCITERLTLPTIREYIVHTSLDQRLNDKLSWRKMIGELLSAMAFLDDIGALLDDITSETVYQTNNTVKLGLGAINLFGLPTTRKHYLNFGKLILEMCSYHQDINGHYQRNDVNNMLERILFEDQKNFLISILDENCLNVKDLIRGFKCHLKNVPTSLKILSGLKFVNNTVYWKSLEISENIFHCAVNLYDDLLKTHIDHFDNDMVIVSCRRMTNGEKVLKWDDFHLRFLALPKFLQDVRNGFYSIFCSHNELGSEKLRERFTSKFSCPLQISDLELDIEVSDYDCISMPISETVACTCTHANSIQESDSVSMENELFFRDLEVTEKLYTSCRDDMVRLVDFVDREPCELDDSLIDWSVEDHENVTGNLIDLHSPDFETQVAFIPRCPSEFGCGWRDLFEQQINKFNTADCTLP